LIEPLRKVIEHCRSGASAGDYSACTTSPDVQRARADAEASLAEYARTGRIVHLSLWMPTIGQTMSYRNADDACASVSMRMPLRSEVGYLAPSVTALAGPAGKVWFTGDDQCSKPYYHVADGEASVGCSDQWYEGLPYVGDLPVVCVGRTGPVAALEAP
jgi:hypothetical protein